MGNIQACVVFYCPGEYNIALLVKQGYRYFTLGLYINKKNH